MKILHVINSLQMGGAEKLITEITPRLSTLGNNVDVLVYDGQETPFLQNLRSTGVKIFKFNNGSKKSYSFRNLIRTIQTARGYDIVHSHTTPAQLFVAISKILCFFSFKAITTEHSTNNHRRGKWIYKIIDRLMYACYDHIICIAEKSKKNLEEQIGSHKNISVIENGIDVERFHTAKAEPRSGLGIKETDFVLTMVGRFVDAKDQDTIIRALSLLPEECKLLLVGSGERKDKCEILAKTLNVDNRVSFLGLRSDIPEILHASDVIIMSSHWEGLSLSSLEGMSVGKPMIASDVDGLREVVGGAGLLFAESDEKQLSNYILDLKKDPNLYVNIAKRCFVRAAHYDLSNMVYKYNQIYQNQISNG